MEVNENENTTCQNLWEIAKELLRGKFISLKAYIRKMEKSQINDLSFHLKKTEKR